MKVYKNWVWMIVLLSISVLPLVNLTSAGLPITHDGQDHVARIANFYQSLGEGIIVPRWAAKLNWGYGHPILMFLYPFPSYVASFFHMVGYSLVDSTKLVFAVGFTASFFAMYMWAAKSWGKSAAVVAAVLYTYAPYRFVDMYVRGAIGEHMAFIFPPLVCYGLLRLSGEKKSSVASWMWVSIGTGLLILSHNALSLMFLPLIALYALYLAIYVSKNKVLFITSAVVSICWGFALSAFFWVPALIEGKYTLRDIVTRGDVMARFVQWKSFFALGWNYGGGNEFSKYVGTAQLLGLLVVFLGIRKIKGSQRFFMAGVMFALIASLFLMTSGASFVWQVVTLLQKFQFPWRLLSVVVFLFSVIGAFGVSLLQARTRRWVAGVLCAVAITSTSSMWQAKEYKVFSESYFTSVYRGTTDTGESSPIWSIRFMEHEPKGAMGVISGEASFRQISRSTNVHLYEAAVASSEARIVENTLYFPGWNVYIDGNPVNIQFQDPEFRGLMTFMVPKGGHVISVEFGDTNLRKLANIISIAGLVSFIVFLGTMRVWQSKKLQYRSR